MSVHVIVNLLNEFGGGGGEINLRFYKNTL